MRIKDQASAGFYIEIQGAEIPPQLPNIICLNDNAIMMFVTLEELNIIEQHLRLAPVLSMDQRTLKSRFIFEIRSLCQNQRAFVNVYFIPLHQRYVVTNV